LSKGSGTLIDRPRCRQNGRRMVPVRSSGGVSTQALANTEPWVPHGFAPSPGSGRHRAMGERERRPWETCDRAPGFRLERITILHPIYYRRRVRPHPRGGDMWRVSPNLRTPVAALSNGLSVPARIGTTISTTQSIILTLLPCCRHRSIQREEGPEPVV